MKLKVFSAWVHDKLLIWALVIPIMAHDATKQGPDHFFLSEQGLIIWWETIEENMIIWNFYKHINSKLDRNIIHAYIWIQKNKYNFDFKRQRDI